MPSPHRRYRGGAHGPGELADPLHSKADYETAVPPLDEAQTMAVLKLLIDMHYAGPQNRYEFADLGFMHRRLSEALEDSPQTDLADCTTFGPDCACNTRRTP